MLFKQMRRQDRALCQDETREILQKGNYGFLMMHGLGDYPYGIPLNYVYSENSIYIHSALEGHKLDCIRNDNKVAFCVVGEATILPDKFSTRYKSAIVFGRAYELSGSEKFEALIKLIGRYVDSDNCLAKGRAYVEKDQDITAVFRIDIDHMTGKARR